MIRRSLLMLVALMLASVPARAQDASFFTGIFDNFHSVAIYTQSSALHGSSGLEGGNSRCVILDMCGGGIELLIDLDTLRGGHVELGLGASYLRGFRFRDSTLDLHASIRSFPTLSGYFTGANILGLPRLTGYAGLSFGLSELWNGQVYDSAGQEITLKAQTFDYGITGGLHLDLKVLGGPFLEGGYKRRHYTSLDWELDTVPSGYPRSLDLSGWTLSLGWQFKLRQDPLPKGLPAVAGRWRLVTVDGDTLPFTASQELESPRAVVSKRIQWLDGTLVFTDASKRYDLTVIRREETLKHADVIEIDPIAHLSSSGTYTPPEESPTITLSPWPETGQPAPSALPATRIGNNIILQYRGHLLTFTRY